ncbi:MAG: hypothetical protein C0404_10340 [Verrucomicrobia bacterium]|nr:hypothetical protein [Verrucomicrobiota bacterium]
MNAGGKGLQAFTLLELLAVIAVIMILATLVISAAKVARDKATRMRAKHDVDQLHQAWNQYMTDNKHAPAFVPPGGNFIMDSNVIALIRGYKGTGIEISSNALYFCDPWGVRNTITGVYKVAIDENSDNKIHYGTNVLFLTVGVWSDGPDRISFTKDDVTSWGK